MIGAVVWKEYREQRAAWVVFAALVAGLVFGLPPLLDDPQSGEPRAREAVALIAALLAGVYGIVCGSLLLANESEEGTQRFLDQLPTARLPVWWAKLFAGVLFTALQAGLVLALVVWRGQTLPTAPEAGLALVPLAALGGLMWGVCCSARARSVLESIGGALGVQLLLLPLLYLVSLFVLAVLLWPLRGGPGLPVLALIPPVVFWLFAPLPLSALVYAEDDWKRSPPAKARSAPRRPVEPAPGGGLLYWLAWRQYRLLLFGLVLLGVPAGLLCLVNGPVFWPVGSLIVGGLSGAVLFLGEQGGPHRFLAEQRFPLGRVWWSRVIVGGLTMAAGCVALLVPTLFAFAGAGTEQATRDVWARFGTRLLGESVPVASFLLMWPLTGFATGAVCGLLFRKPIVAVFLTLPVAALLCAVWLPSLAMGGLMIWQPLAAPLVLLVLSRLLMHPWATERLGTGSGLRLLGAGGLAVAAVIAGGVAWRVYGLADVPEPAGLAKFVASLPDAKENEGGELVRRGMQQLDQMLRALPKGEKVGDIGPHFGMLYEVCRGERKADDAELSAWLDHAMAGDWAAPLRDAVKKPGGMVHDPRRFTYFARYPFDEAHYSFAPLLLADALRGQRTMSDSVAFVRNLDAVLTASRALQAGGLAVDVRIAAGAEGTAWDALDVWLAALGDDANLLRRAQDALSRHAVPEDDEAVRYSAYVMARNTLHLPQEYLAPHFSTRWPPPVPEEAYLVASALLAPWEKTRQGRLLRLFHFAPHRFPGLTGAEARVAIPCDFGCSFGGITPKRRLLGLEAARLRVALRLYQAEKGRPAERLAQLVPDYLDRVPDDPFAAGPIRYRLSRGEEIAWPGNDPAAEVPTLKVAAGQGVIWSAGEDGHDDGGLRRCAAGMRTCRRGEDVIYPVPPPRP